jgi:EmrB/QacA subfamily drug resistance transporter
MVCLGVLMINLDSTIVNVVLPSIRVELGFPAGSLVWVVNAYLLTFGGFLLLGGRLGDLFGHRSMFLAGIALFTLASLGCGLATSQTFLVGARAVQGIGSAVVSAVALSLIMTLFARAPERAKAIGIFSVIGTGGASVGLLLGGTLTSLLGWRSIFFVNIPIGIAVYALTPTLLPNDRVRRSLERLDIGGAITVTTALMLVVYATVSGNKAGWGSMRTLGSFGGAGVLLAAFCGIEARAITPLMPLGLFRLRNLAVANGASAMWAVALFAFLFNVALYLQFVLRYSPLQVGLAFLPGNLITGAFSCGLAAKLVTRFGLRVPLMSGLLLVAAGLVLFGRAPVNGSLVADVLPGMLLVGMGGGVVTTPLLIAAMSGVTSNESGLASGIVSTTFMMGGAVGLAVLAAVADARTRDLLGSGTSASIALNCGYHVAFFMGAAWPSRPRRLY